MLIFNLNDSNSEQPPSSCDPARDVIKKYKRLKVDLLEVNAAMCLKSLFIQKLRGFRKKKNKQTKNQPMKQTKKSGVSVLFLRSDNTSHEFLRIAIPNKIKRWQHW